MPDQAPSGAPLLIVVMGVSGAGKSTVGALLAQAMGCPFVDGDDLHPEANRQAMAAGVPLSDADRAPWLARIADTLEGWRARGLGGVVACSALKRAYRERLAAPDIRWVFLQQDPESIRERLARRDGHFMPASLIESQFAALDPPHGEPGVVISSPEPTPEARCRAILFALEQS